jgi:hypothetical protein
MVQLEVVASAPDNDEDDEFDFTYSVNGGPWVPLYTLIDGTGEKTMTAQLAGSTSGTVEVRVVDTDRTVGNRNTDTVAVRLIAVTSSGDPNEQAPTVSIILPAEGTTAPGNTLLTIAAIADDYEDGDISSKISWSSDIDGPLGTQKVTISLILSGGTPDVTHKITAEVTDSAGQTVTDFITVVIDDAPSAEYLSVADLDGASAPSGRGGKWSATATVRVEDNLGTPLSGATVTGSWSDGASGTGSCLTDDAGLCSITKGGLKNNASSATFDMTGIAGALPYNSSFNSDPDDGDSNGTNITIVAP